MTDGYQLQWITSHEVRTDEQVFSYTLGFLRTGTWKYVWRGLTELIKHTLNNQMFLLYEHVSHKSTTKIEFILTLIKKQLCYLVFQKCYSESQRLGRKLP